MEEATESRTTREWDTSVNGEFFNEEQDCCQTVKNFPMCLRVGVGPKVSKDERMVQPAFTQVTAKGWERERNVLDERREERASPRLSSRLYREGERGERAELVEVVVVRRREMSVVRPWMENMHLDIFPFTSEFWLFGELACWSSKVWLDSIREIDSTSKVRLRRGNTMAIEVSAVAASNLTPCSLCSRQEFKIGSILGRVLGGMIDVSLFSVQNLQTQNAERNAPAARLVQGRYKMRNLNQNNLQLVLIQGVFFHLYDELVKVALLHALSHVLSQTLSKNYGRC